MDNLIHSWVKFNNMSYLDKRAYFRKLVADTFNIKCEARLYRALTRLTFQSLRRQHELRYQFTSDEEKLDGLLRTIGLRSSTCNNWFYSTLHQKSLELVPYDCKDKSIGVTCDCCVDSSVRDKLKANYDLQLVSKRIYRTLVKIELFKAHIQKSDICLSDDEIRKSLRRLVEKQYYQKRHKTPPELQTCDEVVKTVLVERKIGAMAVLKWFFLLKNHVRLLNDVRNNRLQPDELFVENMRTMRDDILTSRRC